MNRKSIHFCHLTDSHLGNRQYGLLERFDDFARALSYSVNSCINLRPDFVIMTGDLFETAKPQAPELRQAVKILGKLKEANIPLILSQGNHDVSYSRARRYGGDILEFLADLDIGIKYIQDELTYIELDNEQAVQILAVNYYGKRTDKILQQLLKQYKAEIDSFKGIKILMLHAFVQGMPGTTDVKLGTLKKVNFDYVGVGHLHERWENKDLNIYCPGSTEHTSVSEWKQPERGFYDVRNVFAKDKWVSNIEFVPIETRKKIEHTHTFKSTSVPEIRDEAEAFLLNNDEEGAVIRFIFKGDYKGKEHPFLNLEHYRHIPKNALHTIVVPKFLEVEKKGIAKKILTKREAYEGLIIGEYKLPSKQTDEYISLIEDSIRIIEENSKIANQEALLEKRYSRFAKKLTVNSLEEG